MADKFLNLTSWGATLLGTALDTYKSSILLIFVDITITSSQARISQNRHKAVHVQVF